MARTDLLVITSSYPRFPGDWPGNFIEEFCEALEDRYVITRLAPSHPDARPDLAVVRFTVPGGQRFSPFYGSGAVHNMASNPLRLAGAPVAVGSMYAAARNIVLRQGIETAITHWTVPSGLAGAMLRARGLLKRHIVVAHGSDIRLLQRLPGGGRLLRFICDHSDAVVAVSDDLAEGIRSLAGRDIPVEVIPMGILQTDFTPPPMTADGLLPVLFMGRVTPPKGADILPRIAETPGIRLTVAGPAETAPHFAAPHRYIGVVPTAQRYDVIRQHAVVIAPSIAPEGAPRVILEAFACGRPVAGFDVSGVRNLITHDHNGFLSPSGDVSHMKKQLIRLIQDRDLLYSLAANAHADAAHYHWDRVASRYRTIIDGTDNDTPS